MAKEEPNAEDIAEVNAEVFQKLRDLTSEMEAVVEHEKRVNGSESPANGPGTEARPGAPRGLSSWFSSTKI
jgi:hypothetical protein